MKSFRGFLALFALIFSASGFAADGANEVFGAAPADKWIFGGEVYLWGASVGGKSAGGDDIDIDFTDLVKDLELGFMGSLAASKGKWTVFGDMLYLKVKDTQKENVDLGGGPVEAKATVGLEAFITTLGGAYNVLESESTRLNLLAGGRYLWLKGTAKLEVDALDFSERESDSGNNLDAIVGLRGSTDFNDKWYLSYYADVGTGDSKLTWQALAGINYRFKHVDAVLGYRYLYYKFDDSDVFEKLDLSGPFAGVKFLF